MIKMVLLKLLLKLDQLNVAKILYSTSNFPKRKNKLYR